VLLLLVPHALWVVDWCVLRAFMRWIDLVSTKPRRCLDLEILDPCISIVGYGTTRLSIGRPQFDPLTIDSGRLVDGSIGSNAS
jgi:hypothetical protein